MADYELNFTDSVNKGSITVNENSVNSETSLQFVGKTKADYGKILNENFLHLLENFANNVAPSNPVEGQLWYDTTAGVDQLKIYDGAAWVSAGGLKKASSQPEASVSTVGDLWVDTVNQQLYLYTGGSWVLIGPEYAAGASTGSKFVEVFNTSNLTESIIINYINNVPVAIISSTEFTPKLTIAGFSKIYPGINISSAIANAKYYGTAQKAETLFVSNTVGSLSGAEFARLSANNIFTRPIRIQNNNGINIGETETLVASVSGSNALITNRSSDGYLSLRVANSLTGIRITNDGKVGILNENPQSTLDVTGSARFSSTVSVTDITDSSSVSSGALIVSGGAGIGGNLYIGGNLNIANDIIVGSITPNIAGENIGTSSLRYNNIYANTFRGNLVGDVTGNVTGSVNGSAARLSAPTTFSITGDVSSTASVSFDGTGGSKVFNVEIDPDWITDRTAYTDPIDGTEEIILYNPQEVPDNPTDQPAGIYKTSVSAITSLIPTFALGMIMPYAGTTAPSGWILCHGQEYFVGDPIYTALEPIISTLYGGTPLSSIKVPDLRGRFAVGYLAGVTRTISSDEDRVYDDVAANDLGARGGSNADWITQDQLPEHQHSLMGSDGTQFYAVTNVTGATDANTDPINITGGDPGTGLEITEGVEGLVTTTQTIDGIPQDVGNKFEKVPPFVTVNYIIYTGV
jgi:microcystin-dependent protein